MAGKISLSDVALKKLEEMILGMNPGDKLPTEKELTEQFQVGRSTIRECLKVFSARKLIVRRNEGTFVAEMVDGNLEEPLNVMLSMDPGNLSDFVELREILEVNALKLAIERASEEDITEIERAEWRMHEPGISVQEMQQRDIEFHNQIAKASGNRLLAETIRAVRNVLSDKLEDPTEAMPALGESSELHRRIIQALKERDEDSGVKTMEEYLMVSDYKA